jgi:3-oxoacyl-[acyl-carrier protein] reductase
MGRLQGTTALVTGAGRGIGRAIAHRLAADGAHVAVNYSRSAAEADSLVAEIKAAGGDALAIKADITNLTEIDAMFAELKRVFGSLTILVNNAGRGGGGMLDTTTPEAFDEMFALNTRAVFFVTQGAGRMLVDGGRIINISSSSTRSRVPGLSAYAASKITSEVFTRIWAMEFAPRQITVNSVLPGIVDTDLISALDDDLRARSIANVPLGRIGKPNDIADIVAFLASDDARWITGQDIVATGGN